MKTNLLKILSILVTLLIIGPNLAMARDHHRNRNHHRTDNNDAYREKERYHYGHIGRDYRKKFKSKSHRGYSRHRHYAGHGQKARFRDGHRHDAKHGIKGHCRGGHRYSHHHHFMKKHRPKHGHKHHRRWHHHHRPAAHKHYRYSQHGGRGYPGPYGYSFGLAVIDPHMAFSFGVSGY